MGVGGVMGDNWTCRPAHRADLYVIYKKDMKILKDFQRELISYIECQRHIYVKVIIRRYLKVYTIVNNVNSMYIYVFVSYFLYDMF